MSAREWKPGDVAMITMDGREHIAVRGREPFHRKWYTGGPLLGSQHGWYDENVRPIRPLVVIDPEDAERVERLCKAMVAAMAWGVIPASVSDTHAYRRGQMHTALREFANPTPRIEEPTGLYAVVEDDAGIEWIHVRQAPGAACWRPLDDGRGGAYAMWADVNAVCVLSEGVPS